MRRIKRKKKDTKNLKLGLQKSGENYTYNFEGEFGVVQIQYPSCTFCVHVRLGLDKRNVCSQCLSGKSLFKASSDAVIERRLTDA